MPETCGYFPARDGTPLYGAAHLPEAASPARPAVLLAPPLLEERKSAASALAFLSRALAAAGHPVLRFDYRGSGEAGGEAKRRRWSDLASDLDDARAALGALAPGRPWVLAGLRLGGTLCLQAARRNAPHAVVALAPVAKGAAQVRHWRMRSKIRAELTSAPEAPPSSTPPASAAPAGQVLDLDGFAVGAEFLDDLAQVDLLEPATPLPCPGLIVQISARTEPTAESSQLLAALGARARLECLRLEPFWDRVDDVDTRPVHDLVVGFLGGI